MSGFMISKKAKGVKKSQNFKIWLQKSHIGNPKSSAYGAKTWE